MEAVIVGSPKANQPRKGRGQLLQLDQFLPVPGGDNGRPQRGSWVIARVHTGKSRRAGPKQRPPHSGPLLPQVRIPRGLLGSF